MTTSVVSHILIALCVLALAVGQVLFKVLSQRTQSLLDIVTDRTSFIIFASAAALYMASTLLWIVALRNVPLSYAYMFMAVGFILVPLAGHFIFGEPISMRFFAGAALIAMGIWLAAA